MKMRALYSYCHKRNRWKDCAEHLTVDLYQKCEQSVPFKRLDNVF